LCPAGVSWGMNWSPTPSLPSEPPWMNRDRMSGTFLTAVSFLQRHQNQGTRDTNAPPSPHTIGRADVLDAVCLGAAPVSNTQPGRELPPRSFSQFRSLSRIRRHQRSSQLFGGFTSLIPGSIQVHLIRLLGPGPVIAERSSNSTTPGPPLQAAVPSRERRFELCRNRLSSRTSPGVPASPRQAEHQLIAPLALRRIDRMDCSAKTLEPAHSMD